ncbi:MAG: CocE/NonD family hydrolase [Eubacteriales bacterium]|nr:CocE/NonD family hydrolase [Eubacteriales bacterium]
MLNTKYTYVTGEEIELITVTQEPDDRPDTEERTEILKAGTVMVEGYAPLTTDILRMTNVKMTLSDGTYFYTDVFRPVSEEKVPAIIAWSPYGREYLGLEIRGVSLSGLQKFEGPDPDYWVKQGYAVVNPDMRGVGIGTGSFRTWGKEQAQDGKEFVEWTAKQSWCTGKVAMAGNSYLAISQWFIAAKRPEGLAAIAPWEGFCDVYRHSICPGGIPDYEFEKNTISLTLRAKEPGEDMGSMAEKYPLYFSYWEEKNAPVEEIDVPAYVVASYSNKVHTRGTFPAWQRLKTADKWLRIHNTHEWYDFYTHQDDLKKYFDYYLKGEENGWKETPPVRMAVLNPGAEDIAERLEDTFPPADVEEKILYLHTERASLSEEKEADDKMISYCSDNGTDRVSFTYVFKERTEITDRMFLKLWMECPEANDIDVFLEAKKRDADGTELPVLVAGAPYCPPGQKVPVEWGNGRQRFSTRNSLSFPELIEKGEIVPVEIDLCTMDMIFEAGQKLEILVQGYNPQKPEVPGLPPIHTVNHGRNIIHAGGMYDSCLKMPVLNRK